MKSADIFPCRVKLTVMSSDRPRTGTPGIALSKERDRFASALAQMLQAERKAAGLTSEDVANSIGVRRQTYSAWENAKVVPDSFDLALLARMFNLHIDELMYGSTLTIRRPADPIADETVSHSAEQSLLESLEALGRRVAQLERAQEPIETLVDLLQQARESKSSGPSHSRSREAGTKK